MKEFPLNLEAKPIELLMKRPGLQLTINNSTGITTLDSILSGINPDAFSEVGFIVVNNITNLDYPPDSPTILDREKSLMFHCDTHRFTALFNPYSTSKFDAYTIVGDKDELILEWIKFLAMYDEKDLEHLKAPKIITEMRSEIKTLEDGIIKEEIDIQKWSQEFLCRTNYVPESTPQSLVDPFLKGLKENKVYRMKWLPHSLLLVDERVMAHGRQVIPNMSDKNAQDTLRLFNFNWSRLTGWFYM